jgi:hypothetical protein
MPRYDLYGFRTRGLDEAAAFVEGALGIPLRRRDSSYRGVYYVAGKGVAKDFLLQENDDESRWKSAYPEYGVTLMVNNVPDMDAIRERLTSGDGDPVFLRSIVHTDDPSVYPPVDPE